MPCSRGLHLKKYWNVRAALHIFVLELASQDRRREVPKNGLLVTNPNLHHYTVPFLQPNKIASFPSRFLLLVPLATRKPVCSPVGIFPLYNWVQN